VWVGLVVVVRVLKRAVVWGGVGWARDVGFGIGAVIKSVLLSSSHMPPLNNRITHKTVSINPSTCQPTNKSPQQVKGLSSQLVKALLFNGNPLQQAAAEAAAVRRAASIAAAEVPASAAAPVAAAVGEAPMES